MNKVFEKLLDRLMSLKGTTEQISRHDLCFLDGNVVISTKIGVSGQK